MRYWFRSHNRFLAVCVTLCGWHSFASADEFTWSNLSGGNWSDSGSWTPSGPPGAADNANITTAGTYTLTLDDPRSITNIVLNNADVTIAHTFDTLTLGGTLDLQAGNYQLGTGTIAGGSITSTGGKLIALDPSATLSGVSVGTNVLDLSTNYGGLTVSNGTTLAGPLNLSGEFFQFTYAQTGSLGNAITISGSSAALGIQDSQTLTLATGGSITVTSDVAGLGQGAPTATSTFVNNGSIDVVGDYSSLIVTAGNFTNNNTLTLTGENSFVGFGNGLTSSGTIDLGNGGTLATDGFAEGNTTLSITGGTLKGTGEFIADVNFVAGSNATYTPGSAPGEAGYLDVSGNLTFDSSTNLIIDLNGPDGGLDYDQIIVCGCGSNIISLNGANLTLNLGAGYDPTGETFTIIDNFSGNAIDGTFNGLAEGSTVFAGAFQGKITYAGGLDGNSVEVRFTPVPEPATMLAMGAGLLGFVRIVRRRGVKHDSAAV